MILSETDLSEVQVEPAVDQLVALQLLAQAVAPPLRLHACTITRKDAVSVNIVDR